jgi:small subunit ribosomal protein S1
MSTSHEPPPLAVWQRFLADHADGGVLTGRVVSVLPFGAFVELADGVHGLLHCSVWSAEPTIGATLSVRINGVDLAGRRLGLAEA